MSHFLFVVEFPQSKALSSSPGYPHEWTQFENAANIILKPVKACTRHQQNVWLLPAENALPALLALSSTAEKHNLAYSALLIEGVIDLSARKSDSMQRVPISGIL